MWVETTLAAIDTASIINSVASSSSLIRKTYKRLTYQATKGRLFVPIFGSGGVGKNTLGLALIEPNPMRLPERYRESAYIDVLKLPGDVPGEIRVSPGQAKRADEHWHKQFHLLNVRHVPLIVNVVAFGYHSIGIQDYREHDLYKAGMSKTKFLGHYTDHRKRLEIEMLQRLIAGCSALQKPLRLVTVVNKQDLWWNEKSDVKDHYENGEYGAAIAKLRSSMGSRAFSHEIVPLSLTFQNLCTANGQVLAKNNGGYDLEVASPYIQTAFNVINNSISGNQV